MTDDQEILITDALESIAHSLRVLATMVAMMGYPTEEAEAALRAEMAKMDDWRYEDESAY